MRTILMASVLACLTTSTAAIAASRKFTCDNGKSFTVSELPNKRIKLVFVPGNRVVIMENVYAASGANFASDHMFWSEHHSDYWLTEDNSHPERVATCRPVGG